MKRAITIFLFLSICIYTQAQNLSGVNKKPSLKIECVTPTVLSLGQSIKLKVKLRHNFPQEKTGQLTLALINHRTKKSVDGWFMNIFPFQYFTTIKDETFETEFPFTVPFDYLGNFDMEIVARVNEIKDSIHITIPTKKAK
ncbi:MAG: hypothetical protein EXR15_01940 [Chitinophagaceae bacterium]|nr:hypothetical protein [Chitinophagaceae bacterium]